MTALRRAWLMLAFSTCGALTLSCSSSDSPSGELTSGGSGAAAGSTGSASGGSTATGDSEPANETGMTAAHNAARAAVVPAASPAIPPLAWSGTVARSAQAWADQCNFKHSGNPYGENIYAGAGADASPQQVVDSWAGEAKDYDYATNACSGTCGHYTQVVWRKSTKLGCGVTNCTKNSPFSGFTEWQFWVCEYDPPGNFNGEKPY